METQNLENKPTVSYDERSGKGVSSEIPAEIKGWSWGAAGLNFIWGMFNNTWLSFLCFVPYLDTVWWIVLGIKGNEWAWQNKKWESVEQFKKYQKKWNTWGLIIFILGIIISISVAIGYVIGRIMGKLHRLGA